MTRGGVAPHSQWSWSWYPCAGSRRRNKFEQREFAAGDAATRRRLLQPAHAKERFENYDPEASSLSDADARPLIANQEGYAHWGKYESYLHLNPAVQRVIVAVRSGDIEMLRDTLRADLAAANPRWVAGYHRPTAIPNDFHPAILRLRRRLSPNQHATQCIRRAEPR